MLDEHTLECLDGMVERSITGEHLIDELGRVAPERSTGTPSTVPATAAVTTRQSALVRSPPTTGQR